MKTYTALLAVLFCVPIKILAQSKADIKELRGNGKIVTNTYQVAAFEAIEIEQFPARPGDEGRKIILSGK